MRRTGVPTEMAEKMKALERRTASCARRTRSFARRQRILQWRSSTAGRSDGGFIDAHPDAHGVEPICNVLPIVPFTYCDHPANRADPARRSDRARRDEDLRPEIRRVFEGNWSVYGVRKVWRQLRREGFDFARCRAARLMKGMDIQGIIRGKPHRTMIPDKKQPCPLDRVNRQFRAPAPNMLWV